MTYRHTFTRTAAGSGPQLLYFVNGSSCSAGSPASYGTVAILPDLSFTSIAQNPNSSVQLTFTFARTGTLRIEFSENLSRWTLLQTQSTSGGTVQVADDPAPSRTRFYRATLL